LKICNEKYKVLSPLPTGIGSVWSVFLGICVAAAFKKFRFFLLFSWGYIVAFTKVLALYHLYPT
jgi:hypothetical protein